MKFGDTDTRSYNLGKRGEAARATTARILDAALDRFSREHFVDVSVDSIAAAAQCSAQTIYRRYSSKEGLFRAVADRAGDGIRSARDVVAPGDVDGAVDRVIEDYEAGGDTMILLQSQEDRVGVIGEVTARGRRQHEAWVAGRFVTALDSLPTGQRRKVHGALVVALDVQTWKRLRRDLGFSREETATTIRQLVNATLEGVAQTDQESQ